jgi:hypothetical protein
LEGVLTGNSRCFSRSPLCPGDGSLDEPKGSRDTRISALRGIAITGYRVARRGVARGARPLLVSTACSRSLSD